jgi:putative tricarboxylic transport membrane protein
MVLFQNATSLILVALTVAVVVGPTLKKRYIDGRRTA